MFKQYAHVFGNCQTAGRIADLVGNNFQLFSGTVGKFEYGMEKARSAGAVEPCQAADKGIGTDAEDELFAEEFGFSVDGIAAVGDIILSPRAGIFSGRNGSAITAIKSGRNISAK